MDLITTKTKLQRVLIKCFQTKIRSQASYEHGFIQKTATNVNILKTIANKREHINTRLNQIV